METSTSTSAMTLASTSESESPEPIETSSEPKTLRQGLISQLRRLASSGDASAKSKLAHAEETVKKIRRVKLIEQRTEAATKHRLFTERNLYKELVIARYEASIDTDASFRWLRVCRKVRRLGYGIMIEWAEQDIKDGVVPLYCYHEIVKRENYRNKNELRSRVRAEAELVKI